METTVKEKTISKKKRALSVKDILIKYNALLILVALIVIASLISSHFLTWRNIFNVLMQQVPYFLISLGVMLTIMTAGIDLSVAAIAGCGNVLCAILIQAWGQTNAAMLIPAIILSVALGCAIGAVNGLLIGKLRMAPFIITLAMMSAGQGLAYMLTGGAQIQLKPEIAAANALSWFANARDPIGVPLPVYFTLLVIVIFWFIMRFTPFGRLILAVGSNESAVRLAGINVTKYKFLVYIISGGLSALAGVFNAGRMSLGNPALSTSDYALTTVAACVIGGVALEGGKGTVVFTIVGVLILALITNIMNLLSVASYPQLVIKGAIIVLAIFLSKLGQKNNA
ncbi:ribose transport system permease protein [Sporobacter termitidis DSM 10068]|uniref:Ribose transport system permease protein n=1 Tax=Sporobacter termitidis DSM 10068 TaxID=1123282 RepID=A0A1M5XQ47_9FIRM|nr:ABC transporter permease [Sporobacter termitidis]SHI01941.1 ribose transport system permease protein [Sporobacter termitidis DSM 10068]